MGVSLNFVMFRNHYHDMSHRIELKTIYDANKVLNLPDPTHPLVQVYRGHQKLQVEFPVTIQLGFYHISMKSGDSGSLAYGRTSYDYQSGQMIFFAPNQSFTIEKVGGIIRNDSNWILVFHPDLIRRFSLSRSISQFSFFEYQSNEALHLSVKERESLNDVILKIEAELNQPIDGHSDDLIVQNIETLLKYSKRYYDRQFISRKDSHNDLVIRFEKFLKKHLENGSMSQGHRLTVQLCGEAVNLSGKYLSDVLKKETGMSLQETIHFHLLESAKNQLIGTSKSVNEIAFNLGFEYPQHFSRLFKNKIGYSPKKYRDYHQKNQSDLKESLN